MRIARSWGVSENCEELGEWGKMQGVSFLALQLQPLIFQRAPTSLMQICC
jgi:hypothetical protein